MRSRRRLARLSLLVSLSAALAGCDMAGLSGAPGMGATPGGVQDMRLARDLIAEGMVPPPEAFVVEGMFSEHDLGLAGAPCERELCLRAAAGIAPDLDDQPRGYVQVGMSSSVDPDEYQRPSVAIIATVDVSGSMAWGGGQDTPGELSRALLHRIIAELDEDDRMAMVTYGSSVDTPLGLTSGAAHATLANAVDGLGEGGSTNMEAGLQRAFQLAHEAKGLADEVRVLLFTDVQPNVGATEASEFEGMAKDAADDGVGLTVFAMGLGVGQELMLAMSALEGGNAFGVTTADGVGRVMDESWPYLLAPIAYDLELRVSATEGVTVSRGFGFPGQDEESASLEVASVFLSKRKGALLLELDGIAEQGLKVVTSLSYRARDGELVEDALDAAHDGQGLDERGHSFQQPSVAKATALALLVSGMREAAELYADDHAAATARMETVLARVEADHEALADEALAVEVELARDLLALMQSDAEQGDLYGTY